MNGQEAGQLIGLVIIQIAITYPICRIYSRAGFKWFWGLLTLVPVAGFFMIPGALGFTVWPSTTRTEVKSKGQHSIYWVAAFSALFFFGIPGADSQDIQSIIILASFIYITTGVAAIYENAGFSRWGGIMGLLGITNLIWPWILAFRKWPTLQKIEEFKAAEARYEKEQELKLAEKFDIDGSTAAVINETSSENQNEAAQGYSSQHDLPPPIPKPVEKKEPESVENLQSGDKANRPNANQSDEDLIYEKIAAELSGSQPRSEGTYLRAEIEADGDPVKIRRLYTKLRKEQLLQTD